MQLHHLMDIVVEVTVNGAVPLILLRVHVLDIIKFIAILVQLILQLDGAIVVVMLDVIIPTIVSIMFNLIPILLVSQHCQICLIKVSHPS